MSSRHVSTLALLALVAAGCESNPPAVTDAAMRDAGPPTDAFREADAFVAPDAFREPDAFVAPDANLDAYSPFDAYADDAFVPPDAFVAPDAFVPACMPLASDYPGSADYACPSVSGSATWPRIGASISTIARMEQYEAMANLLFDPTRDPSATDFADARTQFATAEGIGSRVGRRYDLHFPVATAMGPGRICQSEASWRADPLFCVGPATLNPIVLDMLQRGAASDPSEPSRLYGARIEAALLWFSHLSVYKETNTCAYLYPGNDGKREDCDSAWAYYTGGRERAALLSEEIAFAREIRSLDEDAHTRILDGLFAVRCWREIDTSGTPSPTPLPTYDMPDGLSHRALFERAREQLDDALDYAFAQLLIDRLERLRTTTGDEQRYHLAFLRTILAPIPARTITDAMGMSISYPARESLYDRTLREVSAADADFVLAQIAMDPASMDIAGIIARLDAAFPCP
jgi:hypothetical protein